MGVSAVGRWSKRGSAARAFYTFCVCNCGCSRWSKSVIPLTVRRCSLLIRIVDSASQFYQDLATRATQENQQALMHAVLAVSAQHLSNLARKNGETEKAMFYNEEGSKQRGLALHTLRIALARDKEPANDDLELRPAVMLLLVLASVNFALYFFALTC